MNEKVKRILRLQLLQPKTALAAAFITPMVLYWVMLATRGIWPLGDTTIFGSDLYHQYAPFLSEFRHKLLTGGSPFYTWNMGLGMNFWALYAYYLSSPLNFLAVLVPQSFLVEFMTFLIVLKIGLCGLSMAWYLRKHCGSYDFGVAFFGILYGMSGFVTAYHWNLMWMDAVILFPLVLWGLEKLVYEETGLPYCLLLAGSIWCNYYISIMTCLFLVLYFPVQLALAEPKGGRQVKKACLRFAGYSLLAGGLAAILLIPEWQALRLSYAGKLQLPKLTETYFSIFPVLARHLANVRSEYELEHWPNLYCGVAVLFLVPQYLSSRQIRRRERLLYGGLAGLLLVSFCSKLLDYIWHGLHFPNCFPARESYLYIFLLLFMSYRIYEKLPELSLKRQLFFCLAALGFVLCARQFAVEPYFSSRSYWLSGLYLVLYTLCIVGYQKRTQLRHNMLLLTFAVVSVETVFHVTDNGMFDNSRKAYTQYDEETEKQVTELEQKEAFFRMKKTPVDKVNDGAWLHYPAMNSFCSTNYFSVYQVLNRLGCESHPNYYSNSGATPLVDMLFGITYDLSFEEKQETEYRKLLCQTKKAQLYELATLPVGFLCGMELSEAFAGETEPAELQNEIARLCGADPVLIFSGQAEQQQGGLQFTVRQAGEYYVSTSSVDANKICAEFSDRTKVYETWTPGCLMELGFCQEGEVITLSLDSPEEQIQAKLYRFDGSGLAVIRDRLAQSGWEITRRTDRILEGKISWETDGMMMTTIPYDPGWRIWVDGRQQKPKTMLGAFLGLSLTCGEHEIRMEYTPPGLWEGGLISLGCLLILLILLCRRYGQKNIDKIKYQNDYIN